MKLNTKFLTRLFLILTVLILTLPVGTSQAAGSETFWVSGVKNVAQSLIKQFGVSEARVAAVQGNKVYINAGKSKYITIGTIFEIIADDRPIVDPVNRSKLGNIEIHVADVKIETVRDALSIGLIVNKGKGETQPAVGQRAIEKREKIKVGVMPFEYLNSKDQTTPRIIQELMIAELINSGRFMVAESDRTARLMEELSKNNTPGSVQFTKNAGKKLGVEFIIYGFMTDLPGFTEIQCRSHNTANGIGMASGSIKIAADSLK